MPSLFLIEEGVGELNEKNDYEFPKGFFFGWDLGGDYGASWSDGDGWIGHPFFDYWEFFYWGWMGMGMMGCTRIDMCTCSRHSPTILRMVLGMKRN